MGASHRTSLGIEGELGEGGRQKRSEGEADRELDGRIEDSGPCSSTGNQERHLPVSTCSSDGIKVRARESPVQGECLDQQFYGVHLA